MSIRRYGRFIIDVLATIPFVLLVVLLGLGDGAGQAATSYVAALSLLRLFRLVRLVSISKVWGNSGGVGLTYDVL